MGEIDLVEFELAELVAHGRVRPRQEARADAIGDLAQPEIEARRLNWSAVISGAALISPPAIRDFSAWEGRMPVRAKDPFTGARGSDLSGRPSNSLSRSLACSMGHCLGIRRGVRHPYLALLPRMYMPSLLFQCVAGKM